MTRSATWRCRRTRRVRARASRRWRRSRRCRPATWTCHAPLGTIDAGEAGIRVSGNINIAALHVVNAANIQVRGEQRHSGGGDGQHRRAGVGQRGVLGGGRRGAGIGAARPAAVAPEPAVCHQRADPGLWRRTGRRRASAQRALAAYRPDGVVQVQGSTAAAEIRLSVMPVSHRRVAKRTRAGISGPWSVPAACPGRRRCYVKFFLQRAVPGSPVRLVTSRSCGRGHAGRNPSRDCQAHCTVAAGH